MVTRIQEAVANKEWQKFRLSLKGLTTQTKLAELRHYWNRSIHGHVVRKPSDYEDCDICIRIDNYIKALCRGGQLHPGESLMTALDSAWQLSIRK